MMGTQAAPERLFYDFCLEDHVPGNHMLRVIGTWIERSRQRRALVNLDDRSLSDISITRSEAAREAAMPFWR